MQTETQQPELFYDRQCYSITDSTGASEKNNVVWQPAQNIYQHQVSKGYLVLSKNDFGKVKKRINVGYFNRKTNFLIGEKNSLMFWDNKEKQTISGEMSQILKEPQRYFLFYDLNFIHEDENKKIDIVNKNTNEKLEIILNFQFGKDLGHLMRKSDPKTTTIPEEFQLLKAIVSIEDGRLSLNKQILINSNPHFLLGILEGYIKDKHYFTLKRNINIYNFTYILNLLGAQYSIRSVPENEKQIRFKLPLFLKPLSGLKENFFRSYKYFFDNETGELTLRKNLVEITPQVEDTSIQNIVNSGLIEMIPVKDLVFIEVEDQTMYDLSMSRADATNYSLPCTPYLKNSDGDVLGAIAVMTKDAAEECIRKFSTELKENFLDLGTGSVRNWGVKLDSQTGLYTATK